MRTEFRPVPAAESPASQRFVPAGEVASRYGERPRVLAAAAALLALWYSVLAFLQLLTEPGPERWTLGASSATAALLLLAAGALAWRIPRESVGWVWAVAAVPLTHGVLQVALTGELHHTTALTLSIVAVGAAVPGRRSAAALVLSALAGWLAVVLIRGADIDGARGELSQLSMQLVLGALLAAALHVLRFRRESALRRVSEQLAGQMTALEAARIAAAASETRYRTVFDNSPVGMAVADSDGVFLQVNAAVCELFGRPAIELVGRSSSAFTHPDDLSAHDEAVALHLATDATGPVRVEKRYLRPDGSVRWVWLTVTSTPGPGGETWLLAHLQDITDRREAEQVIADSEANLAAVARVMHRIQRGEDARSTIVEASVELAGACVASMLEPDGSDLVITASTKDGLLNTRVSLSATSAIVATYRNAEPMFVGNPEHHPLVSPALLRLTDARSIYMVPVMSRGFAAGVLVVAWDYPLTDVANRRARAVQMLADEAGVALEQAAMLAELTSLAETDPLTSLLNRRGWQARLEQLIEGARRTGAPLTVALADLDYFKSFNDTFGHTAGDALLVGFADAAKAGLRVADTMSRWGGEEFAIGLPDCPDSQAPFVLDRLRQAVPDGQTCSVGYATWDTAETGAELMRRADEALYAAKRAGRDRTVKHVRP